MEASALQHTVHAPALVGRSPLLRLQGDEKLIALVRRGHHGAFEALVQRYQPRLLAFCRHMLNSTEDAEDVLQEVFAAAFNAMLADDRPINARPWLYRIARNRCLNHLRRPVPSGQDSMDVFERDGGTTTADTVHKREEFRQIVSDVHELPETQRTALLLREIDALSYEQIAEAMDTTVPSVKSLLVRARVSLAEAAEARLLTCAEARLELGKVAEGLQRSSAPVRRHVKSCERCRVFRRELRSANRALAAVYPIGPLVIFKKLVLAKLSAAGGTTAAAGGTTAAGAGGTMAAGAGGMGLAASGGAVAGGAAAGGALSAGASAIASKAVAGLAAAAIVTAGAVEVKQTGSPEHTPAAPVAVAAAPAPAAPPAAVPAAPDPVGVAPAASEPTPERVDDEPAPAEVAAPAPEPVATAPAPAVSTEPVTAPAPAASEPAAPVDEQGSTVVIPAEGENPAPAEADPVAPAPEESAGSGEPAAADPVAPASDEQPPPEEQPPPPEQQPSG
jgi:RNA polymerase sigma factor (sigma-70 family)